MPKFTITVTDSQSEYAMIAASGGQRACRWYGGYATPTKCVAFWRLALNSYYYFKLLVE
ncbi:MAG: hypothetical protein V8R13_04565 [Coprococcus sp.]|uniref:hypothetical protein n=1 Tax=Coprococcus catus TaxID=116085 RepID=UPI001C02006A|nr:hypothetical protein [Coprococcus catus]